MVLEGVREAFIFIGGQAKEVKVESLVSQNGCVDGDLPILWEWVPKLKTASSCESSYHNNNTKRFQSSLDKLREPPCKLLILT